MKKYICIDVGGTTIKHSIMDQDGNIIIQNKTNTQAHLGDKTIINKIKEIIRNYIKEFKEYEISGIGISTTGMVDPEEGKITFAGKTTPGYVGTEIKKEVEEEFKILCEVENDVNCAAMGEMWLGAGKNYKSSVCITIGTGVGGCVIYDNKPIKGKTNSAGEIGYININNRNLQDISATSVLVKTIRDKKDDTTIDGKQIFELAKSGDKDCIEAIEKMIEAISIAMSNIIYLINPEVIIIGGAVSAQSQYLRPIIDKYISKHVHKHILDDTKIEFAKCGNDSGMLGALYNLRERNKI